MTADPRSWFLSALERGNPDTVIDARHADGRAFTDGNEVRSLVHGAVYYAELLDRLRKTRAGDLVLFTDWRGDPDERLQAEGVEIGQALAACASRDVTVCGLVWRSHLDKLAFSARENRHLGEEIDAAGGECRLDMRVRPLGSHHQKLVVIRCPGRPQLDVAFVGGIDLCHSRRDNEKHEGDPQPQQMADWYGPRPPWHDIQLRITGPAVGDLEATFRERWADPTPLSRNPLRVVTDRLRGATASTSELPTQLPDPEPVGDDSIQVLRTYAMRHPGYPFARDGERSVARSYEKAFARASRLVYLEDQYLWSVRAADLLSKALRRSPELRLIAVIPMLPDQDGRLSTPPNLVSRGKVLELLRKAGGDRVAVYGLENHQGTPVYVHAKVCAIDDEWVTVGSDNLNRRSWTHDSEVTCAVVNPVESTNGPARALRLQLAQEHLDLPDSDAAIQVAGDPLDMFDAFRAAAGALDAWHASNDGDARPAGRLRTYEQPPLRPSARAFASIAYRAFYDPDGRSVAARVKGIY